MHTDSELICKITALFGVSVYTDGSLNRKVVSDAIYQNPSLREQMNAIVHPATIAYSKRWMADHTSPYIVKEAAIFFETGSNVDMDHMIGVYAPVSIRKQRAVKRDGFSEQRFNEIVATQMNEEEKMKRCDFVVVNDDVIAVIPQVLAIHEILLAKSQKIAI